MKLTSLFGKAVTTVVLSLACVLPAQAQSVSGQGSWETTLLGRDINRNAVAATDVSAVYLYDTTLNVTWLRDANVNGAMDWASATAWADSLSTGSGATAIDNWRLPTMTDTGTSGCNFSYNGTDCGFNSATSTSEMASLFYNTLGNKAYHNTSGNGKQAGWGLTNAGSFQNMESDFYWLGTEYAPDPNHAWYFNSSSGSQLYNYKYIQLYALAVRPGDVSPAPEPETYLMLLLGLGVVGAISRRRLRAAQTLA